VHVDARHAILEFSKFRKLAERSIRANTFAVFLSLFRFTDSERYYTINGQLPEGKLFDELSDIFKTKDGYVRLHANFPQFVFSSLSHL
jgi:hypothetical protein